MRSSLFLLTVLGACHASHAVKMPWDKSDPTEMKVPSPMQFQKVFSFAGNLLESKGLSAPWMTLPKMQHSRRLSFHEAPKVPEACIAKCPKTQEALDGISSGMFGAMQPHMATFEDMDKIDTMTEADKKAMMDKAKAAMGAVFDALINLMCQYSETFTCAEGAKECSMEEGEEEDMLSDMMGALGPIAPCICGPCKEHMTSTLKMFVDAAVGGMLGGGMEELGEGKEGMEALKTMMCPMLGTIKCATANEKECGEMMKVMMEEEDHHDEKDMHDKDMHDKDMHDKDMHDKDMHDKDMHDKDMDDKDMHDKDMHGEKPKCDCSCNSGEASIAGEQNEFLNKDGMYCKGGDKGDEKCCGMEMDHKDGDHKDGDHDDHKDGDHEGQGLSLELLETMCKEGGGKDDHEGHDHDDHDHGPAPAPKPTPAPAPPVIKHTGNVEVTMSKEHATEMTKDLPKAKTIMAKSIAKTGGFDSKEVVVTKIYLDGEVVGRRLASSVLKADWEITTSKPITEMAKGSDLGSDIQDIAKAEGITVTVEKAVPTVVSSAPAPTPAPTADVSHAAGAVTGFLWAMMAVSAMLWR